MVERLNQKDMAACEEYEAFIQHHRNGSFMQSLRWAEVKSNWKREVLLVRDRGGKLTGSVLLLIQPVPYIKKHILYAPRGPVCAYDDGETLGEIVAGIKEMAKEYGACLFRMDPIIDAQDRGAADAFQKLGFRHKKNPREFTTVQPRNSYVLSLTGKTEEDVFMGFHQKWRYNIRLSERKGVTCSVHGPEALDSFYTLMRETGKRDGFQIRSRAYYHRLLASFGDNARLYISSWNGIPLSGAIALRDGKSVSYLYGASTAAHRNRMPNYLMQWAMIRWAVESGCETYDFMGVPHYDNPEHPNYGVYRFKKGFGGGIRTTAGEFDLHLSPAWGRLTAACIRMRLYLSRLMTEKKADRSKPRMGAQAGEHPAYSYGALTGTLR